MNLEVTIVVMNGPVRVRLRNGRTIGVFDSGARGQRTAGGGLRTTVAQTTTPG